MTHVGRVTAILLFVTSAGCVWLARDAEAQAGEEADSSRIAGTWPGNSVCMVKDSPCHDEINVYRFSPNVRTSGLFFLAQRARWSTAKKS
jgi:hypothetical protein